MMATTSGKELAQLGHLIAKLLVMRDRAHEGMLRVRYTNALDQLRYAEERVRVDLAQAKAAGR